MLLSKIASIINVNIAVKDAINIDTILIDSRKIIYPESALFVCIVTFKDNAHRYISDAYNQGVRYFLISENINEALYSNALFLKVTDTLRSLQGIVAQHRSQFNYPVIGITGSNGKTIIKEWLYQILEPQFNIIRSPKSYNSQLGVALSVWEMQAQHNLGIFEAGISEPNEMEYLQKIIAPTMGIFTNIGEQHSENFENIENKIVEKLKLFSQCPILVYSTNHAVLHHAIETHKKNLLADTQCITWGFDTNNNLCITAIETKNNSTSITAINNLKFNNALVSITIPFTDSASIENAIHCWLVALILNTDIKIIEKGFANLNAVAMRLELKKGINNCVLINDSYNADIGALQIALDFLMQQKLYKNYTVILSDILQSDKSNTALYQEIADLLHAKNITKFIGIGENLLQHKNIFDTVPNLKSSFYSTTNLFIDNIQAYTFANESILLKGARTFQFEQINLLLEEKIHQTVLEVNLNAIAENYNTYNNLIGKGVAIMAMVKAFSYGSGAYEIASKLQFLGANYLAVAYADEGIMLRKSGITLPIMVMNPDEHAFDAMLIYNLEPEIYSIAILQKFLNACIKNEMLHQGIHLKIDTGMHRLGFLLADVSQALSIIKSNNHLKITSVFSHLAASDDPSLDTFTNQQATIFETACAQIDAVIDYKYYKHICNTSGIVRHPQLHYNMVRLGVGLYGVDYSNLLGKKIKNVSRLKTTIAQIKNLAAGETVGYSRKGLVTRPSKIGTLCIGYADGISRALGNGKGSMYVGGQLAPLIGNVCMDMCMLDITDVPNVQEGDEVIVFGPELPITRIAEMAGTIAYEIMTDISTRVKRIYYEE
jgi:Alr-MurF fusion protein